MFTALAKLPADRFESAKTFADALTNTGFQQTLNVTSRSASSTRAAGSGWTVKASALAIVAVSAVGFAAWTRTRAGADVNT